MWDSDVWLPLLGLVVAAIGVFFDTKKTPKHWLTVVVVVALVAIAVVTWQKSKTVSAEKNEALEDKRVLRSALADIYQQLVKVEGGVNALGIRFGVLERNRGPETIAKSLQADAALQELSTDSAKQNNSKVVVQFFPKIIDRELVQSSLVAALSGAGFSIKTGNGNPTLSNVPTNSLWYGKDVPEASVKMVALALVRAGVQLRGIQPFADLRGGEKNNLIQIGSAAALADKPAFSVEQVSSMKVVR